MLELGASKLDLLEGGRVEHGELRPGRVQLGVAALEFEAVPSRRSSRTRRRWRRLPSSARCAASVWFIPRCCHLELAGAAKTAAVDARNLSSRRRGSVRRSHPWQGRRRSGSLKRHPCLSAKALIHTLDGRRRTCGAIRHTFGDSGHLRGKPAAPLGIIHARLRTTADESAGQAADA